MKALLKFSAILLLIPLALGMKGCSLKPDQIRDQVAFAYGFVGNLQTQHQECKQTPTLGYCMKINQGVSVQRLAAHALNAYCSGPPVAGNKPYDMGGPCSVSPGYEPRLREALKDLNLIMNDLQKLKNPAGGVN